MPDFPGSFKTIRELKALRTSGPIKMGTGSANSNFWIKGQIVSEDRSGNIYREMYLQDATGAIDLKIGKSSLYSEYSLGQWIYVKCDGLTLGSYKDMPQLGLEADKTETNEYESSYIDLQTVINDHVFKGQKDTPVAPQTITEEDLKASLNFPANPGFNGELWGKLVKLEGLVYKDEIFALLYPNPALPHKSGNPENRVFLSENGTWGITTWALSAQHFREMTKDGAFNAAEVGSGAKRYGAGSVAKTPREILTGTSEAGRIAAFGADADKPYWAIMNKYATANYVSHYFSFGSTDVQVRTSGYSKFADDNLPDAIVDQHRPTDIIGILTIYEGKAQLSLVTAPDDASNPSVIVK